MTRRRSASQRAAAEAWSDAVAARTTMCSCESAEQTGCRPAGSDTSHTYRTCSAHTHTTLALTNNVVIDRRLRPRCCHLGSYFKSSQKVVPCVRWPAAGITAHSIAKPEAACALRFELLTAKNGVFTCGIWLRSLANSEYRKLVEQLKLCPRPPGGSLHVECSQWPLLVGRSRGLAAPSPRIHRRCRLFGSQF